MKVAIIDDQETDRKNLLDVLTTIPQVKDCEVGIFPDGESFLGDRINEYQIVFLDIEMPGLSGLDVANKIIDKNPSAVIIYITNHVSFVTKAIRNHAFQFLPKPFEPSDVIVEFQRASEEVKKRQFKILVLRNGRDEFLEVSEITFVESFNKTVVYHTADGKRHKTTAKISDAEKKLKSYGFCRVHKSFLVNLQYVKSVLSKDVLLIGGDMIPISRNKKSDFLEVLNSYINKVTI